LSLTSAHKVPSLSSFSSITSITLVPSFVLVEWKVITWLKYAQEVAQLLPF